ncbi:MAG: UDP-N-acetylglucosamine--N-acetylmuramyl-(pentapeptide) pyrophosphoryl-undecaprenol N-acetylglucosamine transferase [Candidatus Aenigmatarchaeota archaeon]
MNKKILIVCERSAGHIFPALTIGKKIKDTKEHKVYFFATSKFLKEFLIKENFLVYGRVFSFRNLLLELSYRFFEALYLLFKIRPAKIIGFGGRDSFFLIFLGALFFIDTSIYELNVNLGKANKLLFIFVRRIFLGFYKEKKSRKEKYIGIPLRENIRFVDKEKVLKKLNFDLSPIIFCFGGSQGSHFLNEIFIRLIQVLEGKFQIIHLTGKRDYLEIIKIYNKIDKKSWVRDFYYNMEELYSVADLIISRAGASTLAEIVYYKIPAILIPHPQAGGHQRANALYLKRRNAALVFYQENFSFFDFKNKVVELLYNQNLRYEIKSNLGNIKLGVKIEDFSFYF